MPLFIYCYYIRRRKCKRYESYENQFKQIKHDYAYYERYVNKKKANRVAELNEEVDDKVDRTDSEILYLKNCTNLERSIENDDNLMDYTDDIKMFAIELFNVENIIVYPKGIDLVRECLMKICDNGQLFCDEYVSKRLKNTLKEMDTDVTYFAKNNPRDFKKKIADNDSETQKYVYLERICERTGQIRDINPFIRIATDNYVVVILKEALHMKSDAANGKDSYLTIYDTTYLYEHVNGFVYGPTDLIQQIQPRESYKIELSAKSFENVKNYVKLVNDLNALAKHVDKLLKLKHLEMVSDANSYIKVARIDIESTRENYNKTLQNFCKAKSIYLDIDDSGVILHLYSSLYEEKVKLRYLKKVFCQALIFCLEKENVAAIL